jgi:hypothetical protein
MINQTITINFSGGTYSLVSIKGEQVDFTIEGTGSLSANYTISTAETLYIGKTFKLYFKGDVTKGAFNFNVLGTLLTETQLKRESTIEAVYNGTSWDLNITPNTVANEWSKAADRTTDDNIEVVVVPISFESGEQSDNIIFLPDRTAIINAQASVIKAIAGTDNANIEFSSHTPPYTSYGDMVFLASTPINSTASLIFSGNTEETSVIKIKSTKTTAGGKVLVSLFFRRY